MSALGGGIPRFNPDVQVNYRAIPSFQPQAPAAAAHMLDGLKSVFDGIAQDTSHLQAARIEQQAGEAGQIAGGQQGFDPMAHQHDMTLAGQAYQKGALQSYAASLEMGRDEAFNNIQTEYLKTPEEQRDPEKLKAQLHAWIQGTADTLPETIRQPFVQIAQDKANPLVFDATQGFLKHQEATAKLSTDALFDLSQRKVVEMGLPKNQADQKALDSYLLQGSAAINSMHIPDEAKALKMKQFMQLARESRITGGFGQAANKLDYLDKFLKADLSTLGLPDLEAKNKLGAQMKAFIGDQNFITEQNQAALTADQKLQLEMRKNAIAESIAKGDPGVSEKSILDFYHGNTKGVDASWAADQIAALHKVRTGVIAEHTSIQGLVAGGPFDPSDSGTKKLLEKIYAQSINPQAYNSPDLPVPGAAVTSGFGLRNAPNAAASTDHHGTDYGAPAGTPIQPVVGGKVVFSGQMRGYGNVVQVQQDDGHTVLYGHNAQNNVKTGDKVLPGQTIALVGQSGNATGPHSHIEVRDAQGHLVDPQAYFGHATTRPAPMSADDRLRMTTQFIQKYRYVPEAYRNETVGLLHGNAAQMGEAANRIAYMQDNGAIQDGMFRDKDLALATRITLDMRQGMTADQAVSSARHEMDPANANLLEGNKKRVEEIMKNNPYNQADQLFDTPGFWGVGASHPDIPASFGLTRGILDDYHADWKDAFTHAYLSSGGHEETARNLATAQIKKVWGVTTVDGSSRLMKYPPEKMYQIQGAPPDWLQKQLREDLPQIMGPSKVENNIALVADTKTITNALKGHPSYLVSIKNSKGAWQPLIVNGDVMRWRPHPEKVIQQLNADRVRRQADEFKQGKARAALSLGPAWHPQQHFSMVNK